jgi:hypothetical protein
VSELKVDSIKSITGVPIVLGPELSVTDPSGIAEIFSASTDRSNGIKILGPVYAGTPHDNGPGISGQILFANGGTAPPSWRGLPIPDPDVISSGTIIPWVIDYNGFSGTLPLPTLPVIQNQTAWYYCDGTNNTPDLRVVNPLSTTGAKNWLPFADSDVLAVLEITGPTPSIRGVYQSLPLNKRVFYSTSDPTGLTWSAPTVGILRSITGPTVAASGRPAGVPTHQKAIVTIGGGTAGDAPNPGEYIFGMPTDFAVNGYIKFADATAGSVLRVNAVNTPITQTYNSAVDWRNVAQYKKSIAYIKKI